MGYLQELSRATVASVAILASCSTAVAQVAEAETSQWSQAVWNAAMHGSSDETLDALENIPDGVDPDNVTDIRNAIDLLKNNFEKQQAERDEQIAEQREELAKTLEASKENDPTKLSEALAVVLFLDSIVLDRNELMNEPDIVDLVNRSAEAAAKAESEQDWLTAMELYARLNLLEEASQRFKPDIERQLVRREMLQLYVPERY